MKKVFLILAALAVVLSFAGCGATASRLRVAPASYSAALLFPFSLLNDTVGTTKGSVLVKVVAPAIEGVRDYDLDVEVASVDSCASYILEEGLEYRVSIEFFLYNDTDSWLATGFGAVFAFYATGNEYIIFDIADNGESVNFNSSVTSGSCNYGRIFYPDTFGTSYAEAKAAMLDHLATNFELYGGDNYVAKYTINGTAE